MADAEIFDEPFEVDEYIDLVEKKFEIFNLKKIWKKFPTLYIERFAWRTGVANESNFDPQVLYDQFVNHIKGNVCAR